MITDKQRFEEFTRNEKEFESQGWVVHHICGCGYVPTHSENSVLMRFDFPWCPKCEMRDYRKKYRRWISQSIWYKPQTWFRGYYEWEQQ
jgi:hypothetical protein